VEERSEEVARRFSDHDWVSAPVVDDNNILMGRITIDDVVDIIRDQAEHQAMSAAGLDEDEDLFSPIRRAFRRRMLWLAINLGTAFIASSVVSQFEGTIAKIVALAALMPIVAGMGGNAGTQVLALMVRGLALGQIGASNVYVLLRKELGVALINGLGLGTMLGLIVLVWFRQPGLSLVIGTALTLNLLTAAAGGVAVPLALKRMGFDPALAGSVILTTLTDVMGFMSFLGLATIVLL
jgi:magnesium transporter